ncbi:F-box protein CPR30-like [Cucumis melo var. makuwa]|uniref:F-box protein CPR30-like n=2 Tax=Cucumis melo TaxID=3656 RepID=A0A1S3BLZ0_CUCME|nr:F-box protein CPR1-like [Cucumis melo]KAA0057361.1 F-box protein CPR30-like [Cucumis melo var. makuwa]TYK30050.1 F-box protein CPR30-like [Cucumis melo var. makuwa]
MLDFLPPEILFYIFLKLPSRTLILCTCVSKPWRSLITDPAFLLSHLNQSNTNRHHNRLLLLRRCYSTGTKKAERYSLHFDSETLGIYKELKLPYVNWNQNFKLVGSSNGLLCLLGQNVFFWNPSIQRFLALPWPSDIFTVYGSPYKYALGFGFDSRANDFKLVRLVYIEGGPPVYDYELPPRVELYQLSTGSWRQITDSAPCYEILKSQWTQIFMNEAVHWIAFIRNRRGFRCVILRFHMDGEYFSTIPLPDCLVNEFPQNLKVAVLGGELCVLQCGWYPFGNRYVSSVWMLRKYDVVESWTKILSVDPSQGLGMALGCRENGEMLMTSRNGELVSYKPENQIVKGLGIRGAQDSFFLDTFVESLALLNEGKRIVKEDYEDEDWELES